MRTASEDGPAAALPRGDATPRAWSLKRLELCLRSVASKCGTESLTACYGVRSCSATCWSSFFSATPVPMMGIADDGDHHQQGLQITRDVGLYINFTNEELQCCRLGLRQESCSATFFGSPSGKSTMMPAFFCPLEMSGCWIDGTSVSHHHIPPPPLSHAGGMDKIDRESAHNVDTKLRWKPPKKC